MANYRVEMCFNWNLGPIATLGTANMYPLQNELVLLSSTNVGVPAWYTRFRGNDTMEFFVFDETGDGGESDVMRLYATFTDPRNPQHVDLQPYTNAVTPIDVAPTAGGIGHSHAWDSNLPEWFVAEEHDQTVAKRFVLANPVDEEFRYIMTVHITVMRGEEKRKFGFDPEMIVEPDG